MTSNTKEKRDDDEVLLDGVKGVQRPKTQNKSERRRNEADFQGFTRRKEQEEAFERNHITPKGTETRI